MKRKNLKKIRNVFKMRIEDWIIKFKDMLVDLSKIKPLKEKRLNSGERIRFMSLRNKFRRMINENKKSVISSSRQTRNSWI